jgi:amino acid transporter
MTPIAMMRFLRRWDIPRVRGLVHRIEYPADSLEELKRSFGLLGMVGFSFSIVTSWTALSGVLIIGVESGGPPIMVWGWLAVCIVTLAVAYSMAEMCSAYVKALLY